MHWIICALVSARKATLLTLASATVLPGTLVGCAGDQRAAAAEASEQTRALRGLEVPEGLAVYRAAPQARIDGHTAALERIMSAALGRDGILAVIQGARVRFFDASGDSLDSVGRQGAGPGEFARPVRMGWLADTLWVHDTQLQRLTFIPPDRASVRTLPPLTGAEPAARDAGRLPSFSFVFPYALPSHGTILAHAILSVESPLPPDWDPERQPVVRLDHEGTILDVVAFRPPDQGSISGVSVSPSGGKVYWGRRIPFSPRAEVFHAPDGSRVATLARPGGSLGSGVYELVMVSDRGDTLFTRPLSFAAELIPEEVLDSAAAATPAGPFSVPSARFASEVRSRMPGEYPAIEEVLMDNDLRVWIALRPTTEGARSWVVMGADGAWWGRISLPVGTTVVAAAGNDLWAVETDEYDVPSLVRYQLEPSP